MQISTFFRKPFIGFALVLITSCAFLLPIGVLRGQSVESGVGPFRTQSIELKAGWNAVYLEVEPLETDPDVLLEGTPVQIAACYLRPVTAQQFVEGPSDVLADPKGWNVWYRPGRDDALLTNLYALQAHRSYLLYSESDYTWELSGVAYYSTAEWHPNAYSLVGFPIDAAQAPTIENFFSGVSAHSDLKVYRMVSGVWQLVTNPAATLMEPGEAYWTYASGKSVFEGPLQVDFNSEALGGLVYSTGTGAQRVVLTNVSLYPQALELTVEPGANGQIPLAYEVMEFNGDVDSVTRRSVPIGDSLDVPALEAGQSLVLNLEVRQSEVTEALSASTLVIHSDAGLRIEVPVVNVRPDLEL